MSQKVYLETSVVSYLTARLSRDLIVAGHQQITQEWWANHRYKFELFVSQTMLEEAAAGDPEVAQQRLSTIENLPLLEITEEAVALAKDFIHLGPLPEKAEVDALHIAIAVTNKVDYLLTWNCKHLANAALRSRIERVCRLKGYDPVVICTPEELLED
ncbi:MAG: DNA-binding protein [Candidatus Handelsmanbacteria bacterium RIFCSPLOWO2_12_FULL_64_10]|uniref:DNA-binding protein n=1 Tax=Handelsmanbacteria sp. (strain RIFCSPLOWO2_12_FULL_64_10) TaxID=1817868 RepID=A0A1F6CRF0_HANXR|nr:MAG: DNA-binding protein [Candidatus Handelsmanbacteria bacterium RIFCSPLOWO2_12_FULL_64_10]